MTVALDVVDSPAAIVLDWTGDEGDVVPNPNGVKSEHDTAIVTGAVRFDFHDGRPSQTVAAGQVIVLPVNVGYDAVGLEDGTHVVCTYLKATGAAAEVEYMLEPGAKPHPGPLAAKERS